MDDEERCTICEGFFDATTLTETTCGNIVCEDCFETEELEEA